MLRRIFLFLLVNLLLVGLILEIFVRLSLGGLVSDRFIQPDENLGHVHIPNRVGMWRSPDFESRASINSRGLQDDEHPYAKAEGLQRVLFLGDSFVEALQVERAQNFTSLLEAEGLEMINGGVLAYGTAHALRFLEAEGLRYEPDALVYVFYPNDVQDSAQSGLYTFEEGVLSRQTRKIGFGERLRPWFYDRSYAFRIGTALYDNQQRLNDSRLVSTPWRAVDPLYLRDLPPAEQANWALVAALLAEMAAIAAENDLPFLVVYMPDLFQIQDSIWQIADPFGVLDRDGPNQALAFLLPEGAEFVDLTPHLREQGQDGRLYFPNDGHLTAEGHRVVADYLRQSILDLLIFQPS